MNKVRTVLAWAIAVVVAAALGSLIQSWMNMNALARLDADIGLSQRLTASFHDLRFFTPLYASLVAIAFLGAWLVAGGLSRWCPQWRGLWFSLAGFFSIWAMLAIMDQMLPVTAIAAARSLTGSIALSLAGALSGWLYARMTDPSRA
ncbi:MAG: hypothetical protein ABR550_05890 [Wenzhouxiangellaceae bacterium]